MLDNATSTYNPPKAQPAPDYTKMTDDELNQAVSFKQKFGKLPHEMTDDELNHLVDQKSKATEKPPIGRGEAAVTTLADSSTGGLLPTISGLEEGYEAAKNSKSLSDVIPNAKKAFGEARSGAQQDVASANEQYPYQSAGLGLVGGAPLSMVVPGGTVAKSIGGGLLAGAGQAAGHANSLDEAGSDIVQGGAVGGALGAAGGALKKLSGLGPALKDTSDKYALSGAGFMLKDFRNAANKGKVPELASTIRKEGLLKAGDSVTDVADKTVKALDDSGQKLDSIWEKLKEAKSSAKASDLKIDDQLNLHGFDPGLHKEEVLSALQGKLKGEVGGAQAISKVSGYLDDIAKDYPGELKPSDVRDIRQKVDQVVNWSQKTQELPANQKAFKELASFIRNKIDTQAETASKVGFDDLGKELKSENKRMSHLITIGDAASDKVNRNDANRFLSLTDYATGAGTMGGLMAHSPESAITNVPLAVGAAFANKGFREYGNGLMSTATNALSGPASALAPLSQAAPVVQRAAPAVVQSIPHRPDVKSRPILGHGK